MWFGQSFQEYEQKLREKQRPKNEKEKLTVILELAFMSFSMIWENRSMSTTKLSDFVLVYCNPFIWSETQTPFSSNSLCFSTPIFSCKFNLIYKTYTYRNGNKFLCLLRNFEEQSSKNSIEQYSETKKKKTHHFRIIENYWRRWRKKGCFHLLIKKSKFVTWYIWQQKQTEKRSWLKSQTFFSVRINNSIYRWEIAVT